MRWYQRSRLGDRAARRLTTTHPLDTAARRPRRESPSPALSFSVDRGLSLAQGRLHARPLRARTRATAIALRCCHMQWQIQQVFHLNGTHQTLCNLSFCRLASLHNRPHNKAKRLRLRFIILGILSFYQIRRERLSCPRANPASPPSMCHGFCRRCISVLTARIPATVSLI